MEDIFYRQMPHSLEAEQSVLGSMLIDANCVKDVMEQLRPDDFYLKQNREIFETIYSMFVYSKPIDGVTVAGEMEKNGTYEESTTRPYLAQLMDVTPTSANVMEYVGIVRDKALLRALYTVAGEISTMVQDGTGGAARCGKSLLYRRRLLWYPVTVKPSGSKLPRRPIILSRRRNDKGGKYFMSVQAAEGKSLRSSGSSMPTGAPRTT